MKTRVLVGYLMACIGGLILGGIGEALDGRWKTSRSECEALMRRLRGAKEKTHEKR